MGQTLSGSDASDLFDLRCDRVDRPSPEVDRFHRLVDMELTRLAVGSHAVPVEDAKRGVRHLLDFGQEHPGPDRVDRPGFDQDRVARTSLEPVEQRLDLTRFDRLSELVRRRRPT